MALFLSGLGAVSRPWLLKFQKGVPGESGVYVRRESAGGLTTYYGPVPSQVHGRVLKYITDPKMTDAKLLENPPWNAGFPVFELRANEINDMLRNPQSYDAEEIKFLPATSIKVVLSEAVLKRFFETLNFRPSHWLYAFGDTRNEEDWEPLF